MTARTQMLKKIIVETLHETGGTVPEGHVYMALQHVGVTLDGFHTLLGLMEREKLVTVDRRSHVVTVVPGAVVRPEAADPERSRLLDGMTECRSGVYFGKNAAEIARIQDQDAYHVGCTGCHVDYPAAERPKLEGKGSAEILKRVLSTPQWKGSTVTAGPREVVVEGLTSKVARRATVPCYILTHPSDAVCILRADL